MTTDDKDGSFEMINGMKIPLKDNPNKALPKRFYNSVFVTQADGGFCVKLDQRILKSPEKVVLTWPTQELAERVAQEWDFQEKRINLNDMPLTMLSYSSLGRTAKIYQSLRDEMLSYAGSDLIIYRSERPQELVKLQEEGWDPILEWLKQEYCAPFNAGQGISFITQPETSLSQIETYLSKLKEEDLPSLMSMMKVSGSIFLAMAVKENRLSAAQAWSLAIIDEDWQHSQWGRDEAQKQELLLKNRDFAAAADFLKLFNA